MEKKALAVLSILNTNSDNGEAVIIDKEEFVRAMPTKLPATIEEISTLIQDLSLEELVKVKYIDDEVFCLGITQKGKLAVLRGTNNTKNADSAIKIDIDYKKIAKICFISAFLGAMIAGLILTLIILVVR